MKAISILQYKTCHRLSVSENKVYYEEHLGLTERRADGSDKIIYEGIHNLWPVVQLTLIVRS
jgi:hypothetical protein